MERPRAVIIGAGSLGLGLLCERMAPDYDIYLADLQSRSSFLSHVEAEGGFAMNLCRPAGMEICRVRGTFSHAATDSPAARLAAALERTDLVFTAVGGRALPGVVAAIAPVLNRRSRRAWVLFCENGLNIAAAYRPAFTGPVTVMDTVMSRMCRMGDPGETGLAPFWPGQNQALVAES